VAEPLPGDAGTFLVTSLARKLAQEGQTIAVCPEGWSIEGLGGQRAVPSLEAVSGKGARTGDLVAGRVSFMEAIRRDPDSRLHLLPIVQNSEADPEEFQIIIDALAGTYDFVVTLAPDSEECSLPKIVVQKSDFALVLNPACAGGPSYLERKRLIESCAGEVLLLGFGAEQARSPALTAA
jgi:hypothetical protein